MYTFQLPPTVSIITATYNSEKFILETYESIRSQSFADWEWLVTDDCSTDSTLSLVRDISLKDSRVKVFCLSKNSGAAVARNNSIRNATGDFLAFIDSDDIWEIEKLRLQLEYMGDYRNFTFTPYWVIYDNSDCLPRTVDLNDDSIYSYSDMLKKKATLGCSTVMVRRSSFRDLLMPEIRTGQDYALWLKLLKSGEFAYKLNIPLTKYRVHPNSISRNKFKKALRQWSIYRDIEMLSLLPACVYFCYYAYRAVFRK
jgi:glycosyltransferase involved in cell wall biosynthesis